MHAALTRLAGEVRVPGDKSISHRALILGALADGPSRIAGLLESADVRSTARALRAMGVGIEEAGGQVEVRGRGLRGLREAAAPLDCANSGTTARLLAGAAAAQRFTTTFVGDASLSRRPMLRVARPLEAMGADVALADGHLPMTVRGGALREIAWETEVASAQVKSAILLAGACAGVRVTVSEAVPSRDHTERMLRARGAALRADGGTVALGPVERLEPLDVRVPGDPSSAAFFVALAVLSPGAEITLPDVALNETRAGFLAAVRSMGGDLTESGVRDEGGEPVGTIVARGSSLRAIEVGAHEVPAMIDELPVLACLAARADGTTAIRGAGELRVKESDRIATVVAGLRALGATAEELPDGMVVTGSDRPLRGRVLTAGDHRIAMAFGVLGALSGNDVEVDEPACVAVSFPRFWDELHRLTGRAR